MLRPSEIRPGLAVFMDPDALLDAGAVVDGAGPVVADAHYFVCIAVHGTTSEWVVATSHNGPGRLPIRRKVGHPGWVRCDSFVVPSQVWIFSIAAITKASAGLDLSRPGARNLASLEWSARPAAA